MRKPSVKCALLAAMVSRHGWGSPINQEALLSIAAIRDHEYPDARDAYEMLRSAGYITDRGNRGIELNNSAFGRLAEVLYHDCGLEPFQIRSRLKHYEGWENHDWA
ncbi:hypothetical protein [Halococcoides cellulosivorans]|uniref:Uncharacterized protein n=1 Tax=Halococcoides cellulosivorans TaxID=1679096 RepID=A0A2R4X1J0_9EURY|nr:hypothetical protein HARCEL1_08045 [Halococcoides cellulosivorans]